MTNLEFLQKKIAEMTSGEFAAYCRVDGSMRLSISSVTKNAMGEWHPWCRDGFCEGRSCRDCLAEWLGEEKKEEKEAKP